MNQNFLSRSPRRIWQFLSAACLCCAIALLFFCRLLIPGRMLTDYSGGSDHHSQAMFFYIAAKSVLNGVWPYWVSEFGAGFPLWASFQYGLGSPFAFLFLLLPPELAYSTSAAFHFIFAGIGMYLLARRLKFRHLEALIASVIYSASGYFVGHVAAGQIIVVWPVAWFAWVAWSTDRLITAPSTRNIAVAACLLAFGLISGHVQMAIYLMIFNLAFAGIRLMTVRKNSISRPIVALMAANALAIGLSAAQWLPFLELYLLNHGRMPDFTLGKVLDGSLPPLEMWNLILPHVTGLRAEQNLLYDTSVVEHEWVFVSEAVVIWLAMLGFLSAQNRNLSRGVLVLFLLGLLLGIGAHLPFYAAMTEQLPFLRGFRTPGRALFLSVFSIALLAASGVRVLDLSIKKSESIRVPILLAALLLVLAVIGAFHVRSVFLSEPYPRRVLFQDKIDGMMLRSVGGTFVVLSLALLSLYWASRTANRKVWRYGILATVLLGAVVEESRRIVPMSSEPLYAPPPQRVFDDPIQDFRVIGFRSNAVMHGYDMTKPASVLSLSEFGDFVDTYTDNRGRILHARYFQDYNKKRPIDGEAFWYEPLSDPLPKVQLYFETRIIPDTEEALAAIDEKKFPIEKTLLLHEAKWQSHLENSPTGLPEKHVLPNDSSHNSTAKSAPNSSNSETIPQATIVEHTGTKVVIDVEAPSPGWLFFSETFYPGWRASVKGKQLPVVRAFVAFKAIPVPAGSYQVVLEYASSSVRYGMMATIASLVVCGILFFRHVPGNRRQGIST